MNAPTRAHRRSGLQRARVKLNRIAKPCMFCGNTSETLTKEHVFADWISELFCREPNGTYELIRRDGTVKSFSNTLFQHTVRAVCASCNNGWLSDLEATVKPVLGPMILNGAGTELPPKLQAALATWAVKTQLVMDRLHSKDRVMPDSEARAFYAAQRPLPTHLVVIAHRSNYVDETKRELISTALTTSARTLYVSKEISDEVSADMPTWQAEGRNVYYSTFAVGRAVFQVFGHNLPARIEFFDIDGASFVSRLWPNQDQTVSWPPATPVDTSIRVLHDYFKLPPAPETADAK
jgi:hypothetical protein